MPSVSSSSSEKGSYSDGSLDGELELESGDTKLNQWRRGRRRVFGMCNMRSYNTLLRVRTAYAVGTVFTAVVSISLGASLQVFFSVFAINSAANSGKVVTLFLTPLFFLLVACLADQMLDLCLDALDDPPLCKFRSTLVQNGIPPRCVDFFLIALSELLPLAGAFTALVISRQFQLRKVASYYIEGSQVSAFILSLVLLLAQVRVIYMQKEREVEQMAHVMDVHDVMVGMTASVTDMQERAEARFLAAHVRHFERHRRGPRRMLLENAVMFLAATLAGLLALCVMAQSGLISFVTALLGMILALLLMSRLMSCMFPGLVGWAFNILIALFVIIAVGLVAFTCSGALDVTARLDTVPNLFEPPAAGKGNYTPVAETFKTTYYPICLMRWGTGNEPEQKRLTVLDLAVFADAVYFSYEPDVMSVVRNATQGTDLQDVQLEYLEGASTVGRWGVFKLPKSKMRVFAIRGTMSRMDTMADADMYAAIHVMQFFNQFLPVLSLYPTTFTRTLLGKCTVHRWVGERALWKDVIRAAGKYKLQSFKEGYGFVITGHSLGGALAVIAGAFLAVQSVAFSPPGAEYSAYRFGIQSMAQIEKGSTVIKPRADLVPQVDLQVGFTQVIECNAGSLKCHAIGRTACELFRSCGDPRGRTMHENCKLFPG